MSDTYERHLFRQLKQKTEERIDVFLMLRCQAEKCNFGGQEDVNIKDQLTEGCSSAEIRRKILMRGEESLSDIVKMIRIEETVTMQQKLFLQDVSNEKSTPDVYKINNSEFKKKQRTYFNRN